jgi:Protein of unknown function (DUF2470)
MNEDHADSIKAYALAFGEFNNNNNNNTDDVDVEDDNTAIESAKLTGLDRYGFWLEVTLKDGSKIENVRVPYQGSIKSSKDLHMEAVSMHRLAYDKLGIKYKIQNGYYKQVAKMAALQLYKKVKKNLDNHRPSTSTTAAVIGISTVAVVVTAVGISAVIRHKKRA